MSKTMELIFAFLGKNLILLLTIFVSCRYKDTRTRAVAATMKNSAYPNVSGRMESSLSLLRVEGRSLGEQEL